MGDEISCGCTRNSKASSARECRETEEPHYHADNRGDFDTRSTRKGEGRNHEGNFSEVHCDVEGSGEEGLSGLGRATGECWGAVGIRLFGTNFGNCAAHAKEGKSVGEISRISEYKIRKDSWCTFKN